MKEFKRLDSSFEVYLKSELNKQPASHYDPDGNSPRAVMTRGVFNEVIKRYKEDYPKMYREFLFDWDGTDTPVSFFLIYPIVIILLPVMPLLRALFSYKRAKSQYKREYDLYERCE